MSLSENTCTCRNTQFFDGTACLPCTPPCASCSGASSYCNSCLDAENMTLDPTSKTCQCTSPAQYFDRISCVNCQIPCKSCTSISNCTDCVEGKYLSGSSCSDCISPCAACWGAPTDCTKCLDQDNTSLFEGKCSCTDP